MNALRSAAKALTPALLAVVAAGACGGGQPSGLAVTPNAAMSPGANATATSSATPAQQPGASPTAAADVRLVIQDYAKTEIRLARLDATDTAAVKGQYDGIVSGRVVVVDGTTLEVLDRNGALRKLGTLATGPTFGEPGAVAVKPDLSQWVYTVADQAWTSRVHLGSAAGDRVIATIPSPDGNAYYQAYGWNASGPYFVKEATGLGGVGPFLEYHFPLVRFDVATGRMTDVSPLCYAYALLEDGGIVCRATYLDTHLQVRTQSGLSIAMQVTLGPAYQDFARVHVSPDSSRLVASRNASAGAVNFQIAVGALTDSTVTAFGPIDYIPDAWLPDGRLVADHLCWPAEMGGGSCNAALDGTYILSADGKSRTFFFKLVNSAVLGYV
jgi:hypothetical protein